MLNLTLILPESQASLDPSLTTHRYNSLLPELEAARWKARKWCHRYNTECPGLDDPNFTMTDAGNVRYERLKEILGKVGEDAFLEPPFYLDYGCNVTLGERFYSGMK